MLSVHLRHQPKQRLLWEPGQVLDDDAIWLDLLDPTDDEVAAARAAIGMKIPEREELQGITLSGRIGDTDGTLYLSVPYFAANHDDHPPTPLGLVVGPKKMVTLRFAESRAFDLCMQSEQERDFESSGDVFAALFESIVDMAAERMQNVAGDLRSLSENVFSVQRLGTPVLRRCMLEVGRLESLQARTRTSLLSIQRIVSFVRGVKPAWMDDSEQTRFRLIDHDLRTLDEFDDQLTNKLQFLLDASLGFINTDQNHVMKVLTVVSVATVPPVILAGIWGMNFKNMPELSWPFGYPIALTVMLASMVLPVLWFPLAWMAGRRLTLLSSRMRR